MKSLPSLLNNSDDFDLYIWDNASTDGTKYYLKELRDPRIKEIYFSNKNEGPTQALNYFWAKCGTDLVGKVDNDCLVTPGWIKTLSTAHRDIRNLGSVACWHYRKEDFDERGALNKIQRYGQHALFRHPWVCGSGFLIRRKIFMDMGPFQTGRSIGLTDFFLRVAILGYINGWYYPFVMQEHMDDPLSGHYIAKDIEALKYMRDICYQLRTHDLRTPNDVLKRREFDLKVILYGHWEAKYYVGWYSKFRKIMNCSKKIFRG